MSVIRHTNHQLNDTMRDVIGDITERASATGLPPIGIFESFTALTFGNEPSCALGLLPEDIWAVASEVADHSVSSASFYRVTRKGLPTSKITRLMRLTLVDSSLAKLSLTVALFFFLERGWFVAETVEQERELVTAWALKHWGGYESLAGDLLDVVTRILALPKEAREDDGIIRESFEVGAFKVD
jgi:hypothetical protein